MAELVQFLLDRIDEDECVLRDFDSQFGSTRWVDECEVRRQIVHLVARGRPEVDGLEGADVLRLMAMPYTDHSDFREEWRI